MGSKGILQLPPLIILSISAANIAWLRLLFFFLGMMMSSTTSDAQILSIVPALITFGDSSMDVGNNNHLPTFYKANYPPYGRDFTTHLPTGRFSNGKLVSDITADSLGFTSYPLPYLSREASGKNLLIGASFASAASGYDDLTANLNHAISLSQQLKYFEEYIKKLEGIAGSKNASFIINHALFILSFGTADFNQNYYINPFLNQRYTPDRYSSYLVAKFSSFVQELYRLGARRIGVTSLPPLGCLPAARALHRLPQRQPGCVAKNNNDAKHFNNMLTSAASHLLKQLPGLKLAVFDVFKPLHDLILTPSQHGFKEATRGCCGTGTAQNTAYLCNKRLPGGGGTAICSNATQYVFWDGVHLSEAANRYISDSLITQGITLIF